MHTSNKSIEERLRDLEIRNRNLETTIHNVNDDLDWLENYFRRYIETFPSAQELQRPFKTNDLDSFFKEYETAWTTRNCL